MKYKGKIYYLGNINLDTDNKTFILVKILEKKFPDHTFVHFDPNEEFPEKHIEKLILLDTAINITKPLVFFSPQNFEASPRNSVHDYDLKLHLSLMQKLNLFDKLFVICIPPKLNEKIIKEVENLIQNALNS